jgi:hypothetical protein
MKARLVNSGPLSVRTGCVDIAVDYGISGEYVARLLDRAATFRGYERRG